MSIKERLFLILDVFSVAGSISALALIALVFVAEALWHHGYTFYETNLPLAMGELAFTVFAIGWLFVLLFRKVFAEPKVIVLTKLSPQQMLELTGRIQPKVVRVKA